MKLYRLTLLFAGSFLLAASSVAAAEVKIGFVNIARLLEESPQVEMATKTLNREFGPKQLEIAAQQKHYAELQQRLSRDGTVMSEAERGNVEKQLRELQREISRLQNEAMEDYNIRRNDELGKLQRTILREVQTFSREQKYDLVVGDGVLYANPAVDITDQILKRLETVAKEQPAGGGQ